MRVPTPTDAVRRLRSRRELEERVELLEAEVLALRRHHLRLAEITDVVQELLVPLASRDQDRIDAAIAAFSESI